jgi:hypothetical protein
LGQNLAPKIPTYRRVYTVCIAISDCDLDYFQWMWPFQYSETSLNRTLRKPSWILADFLSSCRTFLCKGSLTKPFSPNAGRFREVLFYLIVYFQWHRCVSCTKRPSLCITCLGRCMSAISSVSTAYLPIHRYNIYSVTCIHGISSHPQVLYIQCYVYTRHIIPSTSVYICYIYNDIYIGIYTVYTLHVLLQRYLYQIHVILTIIRVSFIIRYTGTLSLSPSDFCKIRN